MSEDNVVDGVKCDVCVFDLQRSDVSVCVRHVSCATCTLLFPSAQ